MLFSVLCTLIAVHGNVLSEVPPAPPQNPYVKNWMLTWLSATEEGEVNYTVEYSSLNSKVWTEVPACVHIPLNFCNVTSIKAEGEFGCVMLRVQAERRGLTSTPVKACSSHGDSCTPDFSLTTVSGFLTVNLKREHSLALEYGDSAKYRVYYGKKGEPRQYKDSLASVTIPKPQEGQIYCAEVQYFIYINHPVGLPTCTQCVVIPESNSKQPEIIVAALLVVVLLFVMLVLAYVFIFRRGTIKQFLRPPYHIPEDFFIEPFPKNHLPISSHTEEHCLVISSISPKELRE